MSRPMAPVFTTPFVLYQSPLLSAYADRVIHGFSGKPLSLGGECLSPQERRQNRQSLAQQLSMHPHSIDSVRQVHGCAIHQPGVASDDPPESDAILLTEPHRPALILTADCVPVILYAPDAHAGAVIHSGWRGTAAAITPKTVHALQERTGAQPEKMIAVIGPAIGVCCYEVSPSVAEAVSQTILAKPTTSFCQNEPGSDKPKLDLHAVIQSQLQQTGIEQIDIINLCTHCHPDYFYSHRRGDQGRQGAILQLL